MSVCGPIGWRSRVNIKTTRLSNGNCERLGTPTNMRPTALSVTIALGLALLASLWQSALAENKDAAFAFRYNNRENVDIFDPAIARC
jgi:hypothetical protein